ncbi:DUF3429 domain-containing protein [Oceanospirillum sp.]|uniref:DUF3429 domain-containing protein n=1 Tax=Oceanospirillum sp. TaxID=2021254 RepID=UPI003A8D6257
MQDTPSTSRTTESSESSSVTLSFWHRWGGYTGLIPFISLSLLTVADLNFALAALISYAALIFSFLCGVVWFVSLKRPQNGHIALVALGGMLWSWCWILFSGIDWSGIAGLSFVLLWLYERRVLSSDYGDQFIQLRLWLSSGAAISLLAAFVF